VNPVTVAVAGLTGNLNGLDMISAQVHFLLPLKERESSIRYAKRTAC
jgi:hypothetical protein